MVVLGSVVGVVVSVVEVVLLVLDVVDVVVAGMVVVVVVVVVVGIVTGSVVVGLHPRVVRDTSYAGTAPMPAGILVEVRGPVVDDSGDPHESQGERCKDERVFGKECASLVPLLSRHLVLAMAPVHHGRPVMHSTHSSSFDRAGELLEHLCPKGPPFG